MTNPSLLFIDHAAGIGGAENSLALLVPFLKSHFDLHLVGQPGGFVDHMADLGVQIYSLPLPNLRGRFGALNTWRAQAQQIGRLATNLQAHAIYTNTVRATMYGALASRLSGRPLVWHMRDFWLSEGQPSSLPGQLFDRLIKRLMVRQASLVIANSHATAAALPSAPHLHVVHNGIRVPDDDPQQREGLVWRGRWGIPPEAPLIGMAGRLRPWKGQRTFIEVAGELLTLRPEAHFVMIGGNPLDPENDYLHQLRTTLVEQGLTDRVHFAGHVQPLPPALAALDVFVHPGDPEPFGLVNIEAMAMARPVVAFAHGALPEIVVDGKTGFLVPPFDKNGMARKIAALLSDRPLAEQLGRAGRSRVIDHFSIEKTAAHVLKLLKTV